MSRLLTALLLYKSGCIVGKYVSIEKTIERTKGSYYEHLLASSRDWHENKNDYAPFVKYMLGVIVATYRDFFSRVDVLVNSGLSKPERIREVIRSARGTIAKSQIAEKCPDVSLTTIQPSLSDMLKKGEIVKINGGRYAKYVWNWEKE